MGGKVKRRVEEREGEGGTMEIKMRVRWVVKNTIYRQRPCYSGAKQENIHNKEHQHNLLCHLSIPGLSLLCHSCYGVRFYGRKRGNATAEDKLGGGLSKE